VTRARPAERCEVEELASASRSRAAAGGARRSDRVVDRVSDGDPGCFEHAEAFQSEVSRRVARRPRGPQKFAAIPIATAEHSRRADRNRWATGNASAERSQPSVERPCHRDLVLAASHEWNAGALSVVDDPETPRRHCRDGGRVRVVAGSSLSAAPATLRLPWVAFNAAGAGVLGGGGRYTQGLMVNSLNRAPQRRSSGRGLRAGPAGVRTAGVCRAASAGGFRHRVAHLGGLVAGIVERMFATEGWGRSNQALERRRRRAGASCARSASRRLDSAGASRRSCVRRRRRVCWQAAGCSSKRPVVPPRIEQATIERAADHAYEQRARSCPRSTRHETVPTDARSGGGPAAEFDEGGERRRALMSIAVGRRPARFALVARTIVRRPRRI